MAPGNAPRQLWLPVSLPDGTDIELRTSPPPPVGSLHLAGEAAASIIAFKVKVTAH